MSPLARLAQTVMLLAFVVPSAAGQESAEDYLKRGIAQTERGEFDAAIASFRMAIDLQPDLAAAHSCLGEALLQKGQVDDAISSFRKTIEVQPDFAPAHFGLGLAHETKGELDEAIVSYREAIKHDAGFALAYVQLGMSLAAKRQFGEGVEAIRKAVELLPNDAGSVMLKTQLRAATESLGRARISSNEAEAIGDVRSVIQAENSYARANGGFFDSLDCLGAPSNCIPTLPAGVTSFLNADIVSVSVKSGYTRKFYPGPAVSVERSTDSSVSLSSVSSYAYVAVPVEAGVTGQRGFCGDARGRICYTEDGSAPEVREGVCSPICILLGIAPQDSARSRRAEAVLERAKLAATKLPEWRHAVEALEAELSIVIRSVDIAEPGQLDVAGAIAELEQLAIRAELGVGNTEVETFDYNLYQEATLRFEPERDPSEAQIADLVASLEEAPRFFRPRRIKGGNQVETSVLASKQTWSEEYNLDFCQPEASRTSDSPTSDNKETQWEEMFCSELARLGPILATVTDYSIKVVILEKLKAGP